MAEVCWRRISAPSGRLGFLSFVDMYLKMTCAPIVVFDELRCLVVCVLHVVVLNMLHFFQGHIDHKTQGYVAC